MKKYKWIISLPLLAILIAAGCSATPVKDKTNRPDQYVMGPVTWQDWQNRAGWHSYEPSDYVPDMAKALQIREKASNGTIDFYIFGGSWCEDTESELPKIMRLLSASAVPVQNIKIYGVDRNKNEPTGTAKQFDIEKVPTLVITRNGTDIGRVIEYPRPQRTWEDEIIEIINR